MSEIGGSSGIQTQTTPSSYQTAQAKTSESGVRVLENVSKQVPPVTTQPKVLSKPVKKRKVVVIPAPGPDNLKLTPPDKTRRKTPPPPPEKSENRPRSNAFSQPGKPRNLSLQSRKVSLPTPQWSGEKSTHVLMKAAKGIVDHQLIQIQSHPNKEKALESALASFTPGSQTLGEDEDSDMMSGLRMAATNAGIPRLAEDPKIQDEFRHLVFRQMKQAGKHLLAGSDDSRVRPVRPAPEPPSKVVEPETVSQPDDQPQPLQSGSKVVEYDTEPRNYGMQTKTVSTPEPQPVKEEKVDSTVYHNKTEHGATQFIKVSDNPDLLASRGIDSGVRLVKRNKELSPTGKYVLKSLKRHGLQNWKQQMPKFMTRYFRCLVLTTKAPSPEWYKEEVPGGVIKGKTKDQKQINDQVRGHLDQLIFDKGKRLTGFNCFFDRIELDRTVRSTIASQILVPLSEEGHIDPMTMFDVQPQAGTELSKWVTSSIKDIAKKEFENYRTQLKSLKAEVESQHKIDLEDTDFGKRPIEEITVQEHGEGVFKLARLNSFTYTWDNFIPWMEEALPIAEEFAKLRLIDTETRSTQQLTKEQLEPLIEKSKELLARMEGMNKNKVSTQLWGMMEEYKTKHLDKIIAKYEALSS